MRLTLSQLEAERGDVEPFEIDLEDDIVVSLPHPKDMPFESLIGFDGANPARVLRSMMGEETFETFASNPRVTLGVLEQILTAYYQHFGLGSPGEGPASPRSSTGSARPSKRTSRNKAKA